eukprot:CAMPEP_0194280768 /NCGR_PEP_ID=MMETSP0169-20130528/18699_1 /TAXON_ID=218684 /ORGANISM="Corethron pennatum, Strain L29A3" /LENGTH=163 /DNA_ID=CAMNT_0039025619 /DNA_START=222 /DNA_END=713 /DNA_ORIENTATION=+
MRSPAPVLLLATAAVLPCAHSFAFHTKSGAAANTFHRAPPTSPLTPTSPSALRAVPSDLVASLGSSIAVATASADIDSMSNDAFGPVFAGGIVIMFAGIASALIVGALLEMNPDVYDDLVEAPYQDIKEQKEKERAEAAAEPERAKEMAGGGGGGDDLFSDYD